MVSSDTRLLRVHQELTIRDKWTIFFRTQGDHTVTLKKIRGPSGDLCARLPLHKIYYSYTTKTTGSVVLTGHRVTTGPRTSKIMEHRTLDYFFRTQVTVTAEQEMA